MVSFSSIHDGMGYFSFTPLAGKKYKAIWKDKKGILHKTALPEAKRQGVVLTVSNDDNKVNYTH